MGELSKLPNIGPAVEEQLIRAGIHSREELEACGSKDAWLRIQAFDSSACIHRLYALEGAVRGIKKAQLSEDVKKDLKAFYDEKKILIK